MPAGVHDPLISYVEDDLCRWYILGIVQSRTHSWPRALPDNISGSYDLSLSPQFLSTPLFVSSEHHLQPSYLLCTPYPSLLLVSSKNTVIEDMYMPMILGEGGSWASFVASECSAFWGGWFTMVQHRARIHFCVASVLTPPVLYDNGHIICPAFVSISLRTSRRVESGIVENRRLVDVLSLPMQAAFQYYSCSFSFLSDLLGHHWRLSSEQTAICSN